MLRSANFVELVEPRTTGKRYGLHSFRVAALSVWNNLPRHLRNDDISREQFTRDLKTYLFVRAFENVCLKVRFINGLTDLLNYLDIGRTNLRLGSGKSHQNWFGGPDQLAPKSHYAQYLFRPILLCDQRL